MSRQAVLRCLRPAVAAVATSAAALSVAPRIAPAEAPNIVFILADDLAWADLGCQGHPWHRTPNIDRLAEQGLRFTNAYAPAPICSASRASILTGKSVPRVGLEFVVKWEPGEQVIEPPQPLRAPPITAGLALEEVTIAECLLAAGHDTAFHGKWHLNPHEGVYLGWSPTLGPAQQGFQHAIEDFGTHPYGKQELAPLDQVGTYHSDGLTGHAVDYIMSPHDKPFFLMVSHYYVHTPVKSPLAWLAAHYDAVIPQDAPNREKRIQYAAFVETLDHHVGEVLAALDEASLADDTLVVFFSDNGGHPEFAANGPLRGSKWNLYEGGIRVPMIARWPAAVAPGTVTAEPVIGHDFLPTFAELAGAAPPAGVDGLSIVPLLRGTGTLPDRALFWHFPYYHPEGAAFGKAQPGIGVDDFRASQTRPHSAIRLGNFKLLRFDEDNRLELYDLGSDPSEQHNLAAKLPARAAELEAALDAHLASVHARRATPAAAP